MTTTTRLMPLTTRQQTLYRWIRDYREERGLAPSYAEIATAFGFRSKSAVLSYVVALRRKGWLDNNSGMPRGAVPSKEAQAHDER
jgi:SOS-response transcriptional repressor LexA